MRHGIVEEVGHTPVFRDWKASPPGVLERPAGFVPGPFFGVGDGGEIIRAHPPGVESLEAQRASVKLLLPTRAEVGLTEDAHGGDIRWVLRFAALGEMDRSLLIADHWLVFEEHGRRRGVVLRTILGRKRDLTLDERVLALAQHPERSA